MLISDRDKAAIKQTSADLIAGTGQPMTRFRLLTAEPPESYDPIYGESGDPSEEQYAELELVGKVFWDPQEELLTRDFGGVIEAHADVHVAHDADVLVGDYLDIDNVRYKVNRSVLAPLGGYRALAISR